MELGSELARDDPAGQVEKGFHEAYVRLYGRRPPGVEPEVTTWRVRVLGPHPRIDVRVPTGRAGDARKGSRRVWFAEANGYVNAAQWQDPQATSYVALSLAAMAASGIPPGFNVITGALYEKDKAQIYDDILSGK